MSALHAEFPGATVLDLFAGSGALGLEALSRGAAHVTFVEQSGAALRALRANIDALGAGDDVTVVRGDAIQYAAALEPLAFDIVLADPPYDRDYAETLIRLFIERPFARWLWVEHRAGAAIPESPGARTRRYGDSAITSIPAPK